MRSADALRNDQFTYVAPSLPQFGDPTDRTDHQSMFNNFRVYATGLLLIQFLINLPGVKFVQFFAPISLACVLVSILAVFVGSFVASPWRSPEVCMLGTRLLSLQFMKMNGTVPYCNKTLLEQYYCTSNTTATCDSYFNQNQVSWKHAIPGFSSGVIKDNLYNNYIGKGEVQPNVVGVPGRDISQDISSLLFTLLAIYFPSVTGIMTGSNMSGDLEDPQNSIPSGTISAQLTTSFVYLSFVFLFGGTTFRPVLQDKYGESMGGGMLVAKLCWPNEWILLIGSFTSTFGAGLQCLCSAPRLLQSIAKDDVIPVLSYFRVLTRWNEPIRALIVTTFIAEIAILIGAIDYIAPVVEFFFLVCYAFVNIACALQTLLRAPNWRPRFRFYHWSLSILGAFLCFFIMFATYWYYALVTLILCAVVYKYVEYYGAQKEWGDGIRGFALSTAQYYLLRANESKPHIKNWRPQILALIAEKEEHSRMMKMVNLAAQLRGGKGLVIFASLHRGDYTSKEDKEVSRQVEETLNDAIKESKTRGFAQTVICNDKCEGITVLIQSIGVGVLRPNTLLVGWPTHDWHGQLNDTYCDFLDTIYRHISHDMCLLIPKGIMDFPEKKTIGTIDVWWIIQDGGLLILLPFLLKKHSVWKSCKLRVFAIATPKDDVKEMRHMLKNWMYQLRINAEVFVEEAPEADVEAYDNLGNIETNMEAQKGGPENEERNEFAFNPKALFALKSSGVTTPSVLKGPVRNAPLEYTKKMASAVRLNAAIRSRSSLAALVLINLPSPPRHRHSFVNYIDYTEALTRDLAHVILVRGTGKEVVTIYS